jgi:hypothetical protein
MLATIVDAYAADVEARLILELEHPLSEESDVPESLRDVATTIEPLFPNATDAPPYKLSNFALVGLGRPRAEIGAEGHEMAREAGQSSAVREAVYEGVYQAHGSVLAPLLRDGPTPNDRSWARKSVRATESEGQGAGVLIAHPDTGWAEHPELDLPQLDLEQQYSTLDNSGDARDPLDALAFNGHGTATATVMISGTSGQVLGISPKATVLPIRCVRSVVLITGGNVARAIWHACVCGADVVSLSIGGGLPLPPLEAVLAYAVRERQMIVCAAAGNLTRWVAYPAAYPDCIAVGGTNVRDAPYARGSYGPEVEICAPAAGVWVGDFDSEKEPVPISPGWGTSFSAPHVAGAAALWLEELRGITAKSLPDNPPLQERFREAIRRTARVPGSGWDHERHGAGILDVSALLQKPVPDRETVPGVTPWRRTTWATVLEKGFSLPAGSASERVATLLRADSSPPLHLVERFGPELVQLGLTDDERYGLMLAALSVASPMAPGETWSGQVDFGALQDQFTGWIRWAGSTSLNKALGST